MKRQNDGTSLLSWFGREKHLLILISVTGILYNVGMTAGPYFEGRLAQYLYEILTGARKSADIVRLATIYVAVIAFVQGCRYLKRLYVRKFANSTARSMKMSVYRSLLRKSTQKAKKEDVGAVMTKALSDCEDCAEGMRKFTTEVFDTGVVMVAYTVMLIIYDMRLAFLCLIFPPIAWLTAEKLKKKVTGAVSESKKSLSRLNRVTDDRIKNQLTYRIFGEESNQEKRYEDALTDLEEKSIRAGIYQNSAEPVYLLISSVSVILIFYFGSRNVLGTSWVKWDIAAFTAFLACFLKLAVKSSHVAKLFNAVQKAEVSWDRISSYLADSEPIPDLTPAGSAPLEMADVTFSYGDKPLFENASFRAKPGEIVGMTGETASGKTTWSRTFLGEVDYSGDILFGGKSVRALSDKQIFAYAGHDPELFHDTLRNNVTFGQSDGKRSENSGDTRLSEVLAEVCLDSELNPDDIIGEGGRTVSGGQAARISLARALYSKAPVLILDDPFAALDRMTEQKIFETLRTKESWRTILLISHRLECFDRTDQVLFLQDGALLSGTHEELIETVPRYRELYEMQKGGAGHEKN